MSVKMIIKKSSPGDAVSFQILTPQDIRVAFLNHGPLCALMGEHEVYLILGCLRCRPSSIVRFNSRCPWHERYTFGRQF